MAFFQRVCTWPVYAGVGLVHFVVKSYSDTKHGLLKYRAGEKARDNTLYWRHNTEYDAMEDVLLTNTPYNIVTSFVWPIGLPLTALPCIVREFNRD